MTGNSVKQLRDAGFFLVVVAAPIVFTPFTSHPFVDGKAWVLAGGSLCLAATRPEVDRRIALAGGAFLGALTVATFLGVDPLWSVLGAPDRGTGLIMFASSVVILCAATGTDEDLRRSLPHWLFRVAVLVSLIGIVGRFVPLGGDGWEFGRYGSTMGHRVFAGGLIAAGIAAATAIPKGWPRDTGVAILASGLAISAARSSWIGTALALAIAFVWTADRANARRTAIIVVAVLVAWTAADRLLPKQGIEFSAAPRFAQIEEGSATERLPSARIFSHAIARRPVVGSGPGTSWGAYLARPSATDLRVAGRGFSDAHNIVFEVGVGAGLVGVLALLALALAVGQRIGRPLPDRSWALGAAVALGVTHLLQPLNLALTPLLFLTAGLATRPPDPARTLRMVRVVSVAFMAVLVLVTGRFVASTLERYGSAYGSEGALRLALWFEPQRLDSTVELAKQRAFDYRQHDRTGAADARALMARAVREHPWEPNVRLSASNIALILDDPRLAIRWVEEDLRVFPNDPEALGGAAVLQSRFGSRTKAEVLARRALTFDPGSSSAQLVLRGIAKHPQKR